MGRGGEPGKTGGPATPPPGSFTLNQMRLVGHLTVCVLAGAVAKGRARPGALGPHPLPADRSRSRKRGGRNLDNRSAATSSQKPTARPARWTQQEDKSSPPGPARETGRLCAQPTAICPARLQSTYCVLASVPAGASTPGPCLELAEESTALVYAL